MQLIMYTFIGFIAQLIDGTLGMAYGVSCRTFLNTFTKVPHKVLSAIVHYAEVPTTFVSMISHIKLKNIDKRLFVNLLLPGIIGSIIGAYLITLDFDWIELVIDVYLIIMGIIICLKAFTRFKGISYIKNNKIIKLLGFVGAFFDSSGGGGWGPIVTGSLISQSEKPQRIIGTVNSTEFFITLSSSITFILFITNIEKYVIVILGLIIGGILGAPIAARLCKTINNRYLYILVGLLLIILNVYNIILIF